MNNKRRVLIPKHMQGLQRDLSGRPIPFFVRWVDDVPDLRSTDPNKLCHCVFCRLCWSCGRTIPTSALVGFTLSRRNVFQRSTDEPAQHVDCAEYIAREWLASSESVCVWITRNWDKRELPDGSYAFDLLGEPKRMIWFAHGRQVSQPGDVFGDAFELLTIHLLKSTKIDVGDLLLTTGTHDISRGVDIRVNFDDVIYCKNWTMVERSAQ